MTDQQRGHDDAVRSATIRKTNGITSRPIVKLYTLEINAELELTTQQSQKDTDNFSPTEGGITSRPQQSATVGQNSTFQMGLYLELPGGCHGLTSVSGTISSLYLGLVMRMRIL